MILQLLKYQHNCIHNSLLIMYLAMYLQRIPYPQFFILFPASHKNFYPQIFMLYHVIHPIVKYSTTPHYTVYSYVCTYSWWAGLQVCSSVTDHHYTTAQYHYMIMYTLLICIHHYISIHYYICIHHYMHTPLYAYTTIYVTRFAKTRHNGAY